MGQAPGDVGFVGSSSVGIVGTFVHWLEGQLLIVELLHQIANPVEITVDGGPEFREAELRGKLDRSQGISGKRCEIYTVNRHGVRPLELWYCEKVAKTWSLEAGTEGKSY